MLVATAGDVVEDLIVAGTVGKLIQERRTCPHEHTAPSRALLN